MFIAYKLCAVFLGFEAYRQIMDAISVATFEVRISAIF